MLSRSIFKSSSLFCRRIGLRTRLLSSVPAVAEGDKNTAILTTAAAASQSAAKEKPSPKAESGGSTFWQRFASFLVGSGVGFGFGYLLLHQELVYSNERMDRMLVNFNDRLSALENKR